MTCSKRKTYICIDLKSFYASVECADRGLDPFRENLGCSTHRNMPLTRRNIANLRQSELRLRLEARFEHENSDDRRSDVDAADHRDDDRGG